ncbi:MAG: hypothetical protein M3P06_25265 [Acidobacteriota bacterium]|nr:hypothetical protein [Acidobacteriota bacterium]
MRIRSALQVFAHLIGDAFRLLPRKKRFAAARRIALVIAPLLRRSPYYARRPSPIDGPREEALRMVLRMMTRARVKFDPDVEILGRELLPDGAFLIVSGHFLLNITMSRWIFDAGRRLTVSLGGPREPMYYSGTNVPLPYRYSGQQILVQLRTDLAEGSICFIAIEVDFTMEGWIAVDTLAGRRYVSSSAFAFAQRTATPVLFAATYLNGEGRLVVTYERPHSDDPAAMTDEFVEFLQRHIAAIER